jgi:hypothetical protein
VWFDRGEVERVFNRLSVVDRERASSAFSTASDLPERWEPADAALAPHLFADPTELPAPARR